MQVTDASKASATAPFSLTINPPPPTLLSISPPAGTVGTAVGVTLTGTNFVTGGTTVNVTGGVTVSNVVVTSGTQLTATFSIPATATPGPVSVSVSTAGGTSGTVVFTLNEGFNHHDHVAFAQRYRRRFLFARHHGYGWYFALRLGSNRRLAARWAGARLG